MNSDFTLLREWVDNNVLGKDIAISEHLNVFFSEYDAFSSRELLENSLAVLEELIRYLGEKTVLLKPFLIFPLKSFNEEICIFPPSTVADFFDQLDFFEPVSVCLVSRKYEMFSVCRHEFIMNVALFNLGRGYLEHYKCFKGGAVDYGRAIYVEYYPDSLILNL